MALIDDSFLAGLKTRRRRITQPAHAFLLSSGRARLFAFEESNTRLDEASGFDVKHLPGSCVEKVRDDTAIARAVV